MGSRSLRSYRVFDVHRRSLLRGNVLVLGSFLGAVKLSGFPQSRKTLLLVIPAVLAMVGMADTLRCMQRRWNFYHGGVLLCVYMDLMAILMIVFFLLSPYVF
jgi:hypothetical protein